MSKSNFFPDDYEMQSGGSRYMNLKEPGTYKVRVLSHMVPGWEWWDKSGEKSQVHRVKTMEEVPEEYLKTTDNKKKAKEFWAFSVYNYAEESIQLLVLTQKTIQRGIIACMEDEDFGKLGFAWGDRKVNDITTYDIKITKDDNNGKITYQVNAAPPKEISEDIQAAMDASDLTPDSVYTEESDDEPVETDAVPA